jgi:hypothetical protein
MSQLMGPKYTPSNEATRQAERHNLGQPASEYKESTAQLGCFTVILLGIGIVCLIAAANSSASSNGGSSSSTVLLIGIGALALGLITLVTAIVKSGNRLYACTDGFVYKTSSEEKIVLWNNVKAIYQRIVEHRGRLGRYTTYTYTIEQNNGSRITFNDNMSRMKGLTHYIETSMAIRLLPKVIDQYERGETVEFGSLAVGKQGIFNGKNWLSWDEVEDVRFKNGRLSVRKTGKWLDWGSFYTPSIPNFTVLELLIEHIERVRR